MPPALDKAADSPAMTNAWCAPWQLELCAARFGTSALLQSDECA